MLNKYEGGMITTTKYEKEKDSIEKDVKTAIAEVEKKGLHIGEGRTAEVKIITEKNLACLKVVDKAKVRQDRIDLTNNTNEEIVFLDKLSDKDFLESIGIKNKIVPEPLMSIENSKYGFLVMEYIKGVSLDQFLNNYNRHKVPQKIDWQIFFEKLEDTINKLNKAGIHHRDLHGGNIMISPEGQAIIIDFGNACNSTLSEENPYIEETILGTTRYQSDISYVQKHKKLFIN